MLRESRRASPAAGRDQGDQSFSSGFCFRLVFVLKQKLYQNMFPHRHFLQTHTDTDEHTHCLSQNGTSVGLDSDVQEVNFFAFYSGLSHVVMKHFSSLPYPLLLIRLESISCGRNIDDSTLNCGSCTVTACM